MTNEELKQKIQQDEKREFREYAERELYPLNILRDMGYTTDQAIKIVIWLELKELNCELSGCGTFGSISENLSALADCVGYVPPRWHMTKGYHILRIGGQVDTE